VYWDGEAVNCCTGIAKSVAIAKVLGGKYSALISVVECEVGYRICWEGFSRNIQIEGGMLHAGKSCRRLDKVGEK
jgi:hypothetical protein